MQQTEAQRIEEKKQSRERLSEVRLPEIKKKREANPWVKNQPEKRKEQEHSMDKGKKP